MYSHTDIWHAIDRLATTFGYSASGLARKAGLDPTTFNKSKRYSADGKPRWPSTESIAKILAVTGVTMSELFSLTDADSPCQTAATVPLLGLAQAGRQGYFDEDGHPAGTGWDQIALPSAAGDRSLFALEISGQSMEPLYRQGDIVVVSPEGTLRQGDRVVVKTDKGEIMIKELKKHSDERVELYSLNPEHDIITLKPENVSWMARIVWVSQ